MPRKYPLALSIVEKLHQEGYVAYFAGGWVRDFILGLPSDDIDIATSASPEIIKTLFPKTIPVGIAFGIILVVLDGYPFEVATFRKEAHYIDGRRPTFVEFSTPIEDAKRRDFTINGMFYDPIKKEIIDYVGGEKDLKEKIVKAIGNPHERIKEDRLRMIRAIRFSARFNFSIDPATEKAIIAHKKELFPAVAIERIVAELDKMAASKSFAKALCMLHAYGLLDQIFPTLHNLSQSHVKKSLMHVDSFGKDVPLIIKLLELFPHSFSLQEKIALTQYLKLSKEDISWVEFFHTSFLLLASPSPEPLALASFFAHPSYEIVLRVYLCKMDPNQRKIFETTILEKKEKFFLAIERLKNKTPLITSSHLFQEGLKSGKTFGDLLRLAEKINVNEGIEDREIILARLKSSKLWPKNDS